MLSERLFHFQSLSNPPSLCQPIRILHMCQVTLYETNSHRNVLRQYGSDYEETNLRIFNDEKLRLPGLDVLKF